MCNDLWILFFSLFRLCVYNSQWNVCPSFERIDGGTNKSLACATHTFHFYLLPFVRYLWINFHCYYGIHDNLQKEEKKMKREMCAKLNGEYTVKMALSVPTHGPQIHVSVSFQIWKSLYFQLFLSSLVTRHSQLRNEKEVFFWRWGEWTNERRKKKK